MKIDGIEVCAPIRTLVETLIDNGFEVTESKVSDYHFHEVFYKLKGTNANAVEGVDIDKIRKTDSKSFSCECHWSTVEIEVSEI